MRIARGIYRDQYGYRVIWRTHGRPKEQRFPPDTPIATLKEWRATKVGQARPSFGTAPAGSFPRDVVRFLRGRKGLASFKSDRAHLRPWAQRFQRLSRWAVTADLVRQAITHWKLQGYSARELRHRLRILKQLYRTLDPSSPTPCDGVKTPAIPKTRPRNVSDDLVQAVAIELRKHEILHVLRDAKTRARFLVDATCGQRPVQHMRARPNDIDLERRLWFVEPAKGDAGTVLPLNEEMVAAWRLFIVAKAWGRYDRRSYAKVLRRCGWPKGIRPYATRHSVGVRLSELDVDLGDIQQMMGHTSIDTTRKFYVPGLLARTKVASEKLAGRFGDTAATPTAIFALTPGATTRKKTPHSVTRLRGKKVGDRGAGSTKSA